MPRLTLVRSRTDMRPNMNLAHRASTSEGEAAKRLLEDQGYPCKRKANGQYEFACPFHEHPGSDKRAKGTNFYLHAETSVYFCQSAACGERGNLQSLERHFGIDVDDEYIQAYRSREEQLKVFERMLTTELRAPFYEHGLTDQTIERFRLGYEPEHNEERGGQMLRIPGRYVIPYLEGRRPRFFRYYSPDGDPKWKYTWEAGASATLFNASDAMGDADGRVILTEGEQKAMLLVQLGYAACAVPGATQWKDEYQARFTHARHVVICYDNDNPEHHIYDKPDMRCQKCVGQGLDRCAGHNPGQDAALQRVEQIGWRAKNVVLPLPSGNVSKTDVNDFFMRDGYSNADFAELITGKRATPFRVQTLAEISAAPPEEAQFLVEQGILPVQGRLLIAGKPKVGKATPVDTPILTPYGWSTMGSMTVGSEVIGVDGRPTTVVAVHPQGVRPVYRATMSDGSSTLCDPEHLWTYQTHNDREYAKKDGRLRWRTTETWKIAELLASGKTRDAYIPMVEPVQYKSGWSAHERAVDPYAFGLLLGDGCLTSTPIFGKPDLELHGALESAFPDAHVYTRRDSKGMPISSITWPDKGCNPLTDALRSLGVHGCRSWEKFIPEAYLRAPVEDRLAILQGLLDTDGWVQWNASHKNTSAYFGTSSERLKDHVIELVESLGGTTTVQHKKAPKFQGGGVGRPTWVIRVRLPKQFEPFRLTRKLEEWRSGRTSKETEPVRKIVSVEYSHDEESQCITVDNEDGLYVTERFIVTHNSIFADNLALSLAAGIPFLKRFGVDHPTRTLLLDRELSRWSLFSRMQDLIKDRPGYRAAEENLLIDHDHLVRLDQTGAYDTLAALVEQNGAEVLVLDTAYKFLGGDVESSGALMKAFAVLDKLIASTGVAIVMTHHHKKGQGRGGKENTDIADPDNVAGSFLWTGWPNATILLNYLNRSVEDPFNSIATFTAFRDAAPPEPLALYRNRESITYSAISDYVPDSAVRADGAPVSAIKPSTELVGELLLELTPTTEADFLHVAAARFGCSSTAIKPFYLDALATGLTSGTFDKVGNPAVITFKHDRGEQSWEAEHGLEERPIPDEAGAGLDGLDGDPLFAFDAAGLR